MRVLGLAVHCSRARKVPCVQSRLLHCIGNNRQMCERQTAMPQQHRHQETKPTEPCALRWSEVVVRRSNSLWCPGKQINAAGHCRRSMLQSLRCGDCHSIRSSLFTATAYLEWRMQCITQQAHCKLGRSPQQQSRAQQGALPSCQMLQSATAASHPGQGRTVAHPWLALSPSSVRPPGSSSAHPRSEDWAASASVLPSRRPEGGRDTSQQCAR